MKERVLCNSVFLCLAAILKKEHKEKGKEVLKKEKKKLHQQIKKKGNKEKKFRNTCILLWSCGESYCCLLELGPGQV